MDAFELKDRLSDKLGEQESRDLLSFIYQQGGGEQVERIARVETKLDGNADRLARLEARMDKLESRMDTVYGLQVRLLQWMVGIGITLTSIGIGILIKVF